MLNVDKVYVIYISYNDINFVNMQDIYVFCLFGFFRPTREFFTRVETPTLPEKGCKF